MGAENIARVPARPVSQFHCELAQDGTGYTVSLVFADDPPHGSYKPKNMREVVELLTSVVWRKPSLTK